MYYNIEVKMPDFEGFVRFLTFINQSWKFKGTGLLALGVLALLFAYYLQKRGNSRDYSFWLFVTVSLIIVLYGAVILLLQPAWWNPPV